MTDSSNPVNHESSRNHASILSTTSTKNKEIGLSGATAFVIGNMIGSGIFLLPASLASFGGISVIGWIISALGGLTLAKVFSGLGKRFPKTGGPYTFAKQGFGEFPAFLVAWGYWISICCTNAAITVTMLSYLSVFFPVLDTSSIIETPILPLLNAFPVVDTFLIVDTSAIVLDTFLVVDSFHIIDTFPVVDAPSLINTSPQIKGSPLIASVTGLGTIWFLTYINTRGVKEASWIQLVTTVLKLVPLILIAIVGMFFIELAHFQPLNLSGESDFAAITATATLTLFAFLGIESATIPADNIENPRVTIPRATMIGTWIAIFVYILGSIAVMGIIPPETLQNSAAPFADAAVVIWGESARNWVALGIVISTFGALNGWIMMQGQIPMAAAKDKLFPSLFGKVNKNNMPATGLMFSSLLISGLMLMNYSKSLVKTFEFMILLATLTCLVPYLFSTATHLLFALRSGKKWSWVWGSIAFIFSMWAVVGSGEEIVFWGFLALMSGIPIYVWIKR